MRLCLNMLIFTHNLGNWLIQSTERCRREFKLTSSAVLRFNSVRIDRQ